MAEICEGFSGTTLEELARHIEGGSRAVGKS
jgi:hypothetical protein